MLLDESERFHAVLPLSDYADFLEALEQVDQLVARGFFVVDNNYVDRHFGGTLSIGRLATAGNSGPR
jgi:hypothetical protein